MELIYIIIIIILIAIIFYMYQKQESYKNENFDTITDQVTSAVNDLYSTDLSYMRTLGKIASSIINTNDTMTIPATNTNFSNMTLNGDLSSTGDVNIEGNLVVNGTATFTNKASVYPQYMIVYFTSNTQIPLGWAPCDGNKYSINNKISTDNPYNYIKDDANGILTPDLSKILKSLSYYNNDNNNILFIMKL